MFTTILNVPIINATKNTLTKDFLRLIILPFFPLIEGSIFAVFFFKICGLNLNLTLKFKAW